MADFVADRRAATPTAAAELATPVTKADILAWINERQTRAFQASNRIVRENQERVNKLAQSVIFRQPERLYDGYLQKLDRLNMSLVSSFKENIASNKDSEIQIRHRLQSIDLMSRINRYQDRITSLSQQLTYDAKASFESKLRRFEKAQDTLLSLDTSRIIARGYAMLHKGEEVIASVEQIEKGDHLNIQLKDGQLEVEVKDVN